MSGLLIALLYGFVLGMVLRRPKTKLVMESESETIARLRASLQADVDRAEKALLNPSCSWSRGDDLRTVISITRDVLRELPEEPSHA